ALHHQVHAAVHLRDSERAGEHAVVACDAARLARALDYSILRALARVSGTDLRARRLIAVHADDGHRLCRLRPIDVVELDHRLAAVRVTLRTRLHTRVAA